MTAKPGDVLRNYVKEKLARGEVVASMTVRLVHGVEIARIAKTAGFDSLYVDMEHSSFSLETMSQICMAALEVGITPFVRVPGLADVQRILDAGALGIIAPHVQTAAEARDYVKAAKYPPLGDRSNAGNLPHLHYRSFPAAEAYAAVDAATMVIVQFESAKAIENADAIMAIEGVDMVLIGTNDLLADYGLPGQYDHPKVHDAYTKALAACRKHAKHLAVGGFASRADLAAKYVRMGARYVSTGTDLGFLLAACAAKAKEVADMAVE
jgi:2-keto-3-deoxy-L-rhamnonate aldolase RhmA